MSYKSITTTTTCFQNESQPSCKRCSPKSILGEGDVKITSRVWATISTWNAGRVLTLHGYASYKEEKKLIQAMESAPNALDKIKYTATWVKIVLNAIIKKEGSGVFLVGEESTNCPKIKQPEYMRGISVIEITRIIQAHRQTLKNWARQKSQTKQKNIVLKNETTLIQKPLEEIIVPDSWEDDVVPVDTTKLYDITSKL